MYKGRPWIVLLAAAVVIGAGWARPRPPYVPSPPLVLDVNTAPPAILTCLPMVGPSLLGKIEAARAAAPLRDEADFDRIKGIGPKTVALLRPFFTYGPRTGPEPQAARERSSTITRE